MRFNQVSVQDGDSKVDLLAGELRWDGQHRPIWAYYLNVQYRHISDAIRILVELKLDSVSCLIIIESLARLSVG